VTARRTTRWPNPVWPPVGLFEPQATSVVQIFREPPSRLRVPYQSDRGRSPSASCLMHDRPFHGAPQPSDEPWRRFHDAQLPCYARLVPCFVPCRCPLESIFRLSKPLANYEPFIEPPAQAGGDYSSASRQLPRARVIMYGHVAQYGRGSLPEECSTFAPWHSS
jgi:hypothetical protein